MSRRSRSNIAIGLTLILVGAWFLAGRFFPELRILIGPFSWPMIIIGVGIVMLIFGLLVGAPGMAVPAVVVGGIGGLLYYQNATGDWASWSYAWALIPGFAGVGTVVAGLLGERPRQSLRAGLNLIVISLVLFVVFGSLLGGFTLLGDYWPVLLILLGGWILVRGLLRGR